VRIPRVIHQIWLGPSPLPEQDAVFVETWKRLHPAWEHRLWTEDNLPADVRPEVRERLRVPAERSDLLRLELVARYGGVYVDTDFEALRPLDPLLEDVELFAAYLRDDFEDGSDQPARINNAIFGAIAHHPVLLKALAEARPSACYGLDKHGVGPMFLDRMLRNTDATIFDRHLFYPWTYEREGAVAFHHQARTWKDAEGMRRSLRLAERRHRAARLELRELAARRQMEDLSPSPTVRARWELLRVEKLARRIERKLRWEGGRVRRAAQQQITPAAQLARARLTGALPAPDTVAVPHTIHLIQLDGTPSSNLTHQATAWQLANPGWQIKLWTDTNLPHDGIRPETTQPLRAPAERADLLRLDLLKREGGIAVHPDLTPRRLARLARTATCFAAANDDTATTTLLGATPNHPAIDAAIAQQHPREWSGYDPDATGTGALTRARNNGADITLLHHIATPTPDEATTRATLLHHVLTIETELAELETRIAGIRRRASG